MGLVNIDDVEAGMTLAEDLFSPNGRLLLKRGGVFKSSMLHTCKAWGITQADIVGYDQVQINEARLARIDPACVVSAEAFIQPWLTQANLEHPAMGEIVRIALERTARKLSTGELQADQHHPVESNSAYTQTQHKIQKNKGSLSSATLRLIHEQTELMSLPDIFAKIMGVLESPFTSSTHIADVIAKDGSLTAKLLKVVNSSFYALPTKIDSVSRAVTLLGTKKLISIAAGISVLKHFEGIPIIILDMEKFWKHIISCGIYAALIATHQPELSVERFFVAGLLHDLGRMIMIKNMPEKVLNAIHMSRRKQIPLFQAEQILFGFDHAEVGAQLCRKWNFPEGMADMIQYHHEPASADEVLASSVIHLANLMAISVGEGTSGDGIFPPLDTAAWEAVGIDISDLYPIVLQADRQIQEIVHIFLAKE